jgi:hypothetical protein
MTGRRREFRRDALAKGRCRRVPSRWETELGQWVNALGFFSSHPSPTFRPSAGYQRLDSAVAGALAELPEPWQWRATASRCNPWL